jgi:hypothetical protein
MTAAIAQLRLTLDGVDLAEKVDPRFLELTLTEKRGGEADELALTLHNADGKLALPEPGKILALSLGWKSGDDVNPGLIDKGRFTVDEVEASGPPDQIRITARSADFAGAYRKRRSHAWHNTTLGAVLATIAKRHGITARVHPDLASKAIATLDQHAKSDMALVRDLGSRYDAVATWKARLLLFMPIGGTTTAGGATIAAHTLTRADAGRWSFTRAQRDQNDGVQAQWHDQDAGRRRTVSTGGDNPKRLKRVYATEAEATQAAEAEKKKRGRGGYKFDLDLARANCALQPNQRITLSGWGAKIDAIGWLVESIETSSSARGMAQKLKLESA